MAEQQLVLMEAEVQNNGSSDAESAIEIKPRIKLHESQSWLVEEHTSITNQDVAGYVSFYTVYNMRLRSRLLQRSESAILKSLQVLTSIMPSNYHDKSPLHIVTPQSNPFLRRLLVSL
jgi:hypothetical protein